MFPELIETDRLRLERFDAAIDPHEFYRHAGARRSETVAEETTYVRWDPHKHPKESSEVIELFRSGWEDNETATYAVTPRAGEPGAGAFAGNTGLTVEWDERAGMPGIWLRKPFWGRGYSGERAIALATLAFERLDLELLRVPVLPDNDKSISAVSGYVERMGGRREGLLRNHVVTNDGTVCDSVQFSVSRAEFADSDVDTTVTMTDELDESVIEASADP